MASICDEYFVQYNAKDVIQYALSVGAGSQLHAYNQDIRFVFDDHVNFAIVPTFAFVLIFWAKRNVDGIGNTSSIPPFPPPIMSSMGVMPKESIKGNVDVQKYPLIHTSQSIVWERDLPVPTKEKNFVVVMIKGKFISVIPKSVGTFVTTEYDIHEKSNDGAINRWTLIGTIQFTTLILGIPSEMVHPYNNHHESSVSNYIKSRNTIQSLVSNTTVMNRLLLFEEEYFVRPNTAMMYRIASGDSNPMHIDPKLVPDMGDNDRNIHENKKLPFIHGLCTLGIVVRIIVQFLHRRYDDYDTKFSVRFLDCRFKTPVFINDTIIIRAWEVSGAVCCNGNIDNGISIEFNVAQKASDSILVDGGKIHISFNHSNKNTFRLRSQL